MISAMIVRSSDVPFETLGPVILSVTRNTVCRSRGLCVHAEGDT